ncbi:MAG: Ig-like domain-containing protein [Bacilli bacterium]
MKHVLKRLFLATFLFAFGFSGCSMKNPVSSSDSSISSSNDSTTSTSEYVPIDYVYFPDHETKTIVETKTLQMTYGIMPENATEKTVRFASANSEIATVSSTGLVTGIKMGTTTIILSTKDGSSVDSLIVEVKPYVRATSLKIRETSKDVLIGGFKILNVDILPQDASFPEVNYSSSNESIMKVSDSGNV